MSSMCGCWGFYTGEGWLYMAAVMDLYSRRIIG
jgi:hypothetical protein